ncbi:uncharacterized protein ARMOST_12623 [Armillaria ostoyae]|uniref:Uncharacterized protein n=1 Tax=Armillaria ostoyae TaxID=47428 RepID=A0A284RKG8_ARMOS|nr:uncharacterized protein ARMOST_12623 [Armillaria ostoyae]
MFNGKQLHTDEIVIFDRYSTRTRYKVYADLAKLVGITASSASGSISRTRDHQYSGKVMTPIKHQLTL